MKLMLIPLIEIFKEAGINISYNDLIYMALPKYNIGEKGNSITVADKKRFEKILEKFEHRIGEIKLQLMKYGVSYFYFI